MLKQRARILNLKLFLLLISLVVPPLAFAESPLVTVEAIQTPIAVIPGTGATSLGKAEDAPHVSGDTGVLGLAVRNEGQSALSGTEGDNTPLGVSRTGILYVGPSTDGSAFNSIKVEDSASASGDGITAIACRANTAATSVTVGADGDYAVPACTTTGALQVVSIGQALGKSVDRLEDDTWTSADAMSVVGGVSADAMAQFQSASSETAHLVLDRGGRLVTTLAPQGETWKACSSAATNTADTQIKANVTSNYIYVTSYTCNNNSAVASILTFKSNATAIWSDYVSANTLSANRISMTFPIPLRLASNEALNFAMTTTATSTICCAAGYISVV